MVFEIIEKIREYLVEKNDVFVQEKLKKEEEEKVKEENMGKKYISETRLDFTPVNKDTFSQWLKKYTQEREKIKEEQKAKRSKEQVDRDNRTTGKAYFMEKQGLDGSNIMLGEDDIDALVEDEKMDDEEDDDQAKYFDEDVFDDDDIDDIDLD